MISQNESTTIATVGERQDISYCTIRASEGVFDKITIYLSIYIPVLLGPILTLLLCIISLPFSSHCLPSSSSCCSAILLPSLIILHVSNYYINLFLADTQHNDFYYILIKYGLGFSFIIISPILIIITQEDIRLGVKKTFKGKVLCKVEAAEKSHSVTMAYQRKSTDYADQVDV